MAKLRPQSPRPWHAPSQKRGCRRRAGAHLALAALVVVVASASGCFRYRTHVPGVVDMRTDASGGDRVRARVDNTRDDDLFLLLAGNGVTVRGQTVVVEDRHYWIGGFIPLYNTNARDELTVLVNATGAARDFHIGESYNEFDVIVAAVLPSVVPLLGYVLPSWTFTAHAKPVRTPTTGLHRTDRDDVNTDPRHLPPSTTTPTEDAPPPPGIPAVDDATAPIERAPDEIAPDEDAAGGGGEATSSTAKKPFTDDDGAQSIPPSSTTNPAPPTTKPEPPTTNPAPPTTNPAPPTTNPAPPTTNPPPPPPLLDPAESGDSE